MASVQHDTVFPEEYMDDDDDDDESQEDEEEEEDDDDVLGDDEENEPSPSTSSALAVTVAVPGSAISNGDTAPISTATATATTTATTIVIADSPDSKRQRVEQIEEKKPLDDSRRLFQRLWTDGDEIELLQGFLDYTSQRGSSHHNDTALFYDQIKSKLQLDFNKNQLVEKIRRLKKKYRNVLNKLGSGKEFSFKSAHDQATFEISRKIWNNMGPIGGAVEDNALDDDEINLNPSLNLNPNPNPNFTPKNEVMFGNSAEKKTTPSRKRSRPRSGMRTDEKRESNDGSVSNKDHHNCISNTTTTATATTTAAATTQNNNNNNNNNNNCNSGHSIPGLIEETVRSCLSPLLKELVGGAMGGPFGARGFGGGGFSLNLMPFSYLGLGSGEVADDKWRKQQIMELQVYSKRLELVQDQIKAALEELRSTGAGGGGGGGGG